MEIFSTLSQETKRKIILGTALLAAVVAVLTLLIWLRRPPTQTLYFHDTGYTFKHGVAVSPSDNTLLLATSRNFVKYQPTTGVTERLMNDGPLPEISNISWSQDQSKALFTAYDITLKDSLGGALRERRSLSLDNVWWLADFKTKQYIPLGQGVKQAFWTKGDSGVVVVGQPSLGKPLGVYTIRLPDLAFTPIYTKDNLLNAYSAGDDFLLYSVENKQGVLSRLHKGKETQIMNGLSRSPLVNKAGTMAVVMLRPDDADLEDPEFTEDDMVLIDTSTGATLKQLAKKQTQDGSWSSRDDIFYFEQSSSNELFLVKVTGKKVAVTKLKVAPKPRETLHTLLVGSGDELFVLDKQKRLSFGSSDKTKSVPELKIDQISSETGFIGDGFAIFFYPNTNVYGISITAEPLEAHKQKALEALRARGINPDLQEIFYQHEDEALEPPPLEPANDEEFHEGE